MILTILGIIIGLIILLLIVALIRTLLTPNKVSVYKAPKFKLMLEQDALEVLD